MQKTYILNLEERKPREKVLIKWEAPAGVEIIKAKPMCGCTLTTFTKDRITGSIKLPPIPSYITKKSIDSTKKIKLELLDSGVKINATLLVKSTITSE